jgi:hypothetical protein
MIASKIVSDVENKKIHICSLSLVPDEGEGFEWMLFVESLETDDPEDEKLLEDLKKNKKNYHNFYIPSKNPEICEIVFGKLKDDIINQINLSYGKALNEYKSEY